MKKKVLIADDHRIFREGLLALLNSLENVEVLGEAEDGRALVKMTKQMEPDMVILDVAMPGMNGIEAAHYIKTLNDNIKVLALSMHSDSRFVTQMLQAGATGYLLKDCAFDELTEAMEVINNDQVYLSPGITSSLVKNYLQHVSADEPVDREVLTPREREILQLLAEGKSTQESASLLNISKKTVETHRRQLMNKLDLHSIAELTRYAIREGIIQLDG